MLLNVSTYFFMFKTEETNLATDCHRPVKNAMHAQDSRLWRVDYRCAEHRPKHATIADGEGSSIHVLNSQLILTSL